jgi:hypothetical protein
VTAVALVKDCSAEAQVFGHRALECVASNVTVGALAHHLIRKGDHSVISDQARTRT